MTDEGQVYNMHIGGGNLGVDITVTATTHTDDWSKKFDPVWDDITDFIAIKMNTL